MILGIVTRRVGRNDGQGRVNLEIAREALAQGHAVRLFAEHADAEILAAGARLTRLSAPGFLPGRLLRDQVLALRAAVAGGGCDAMLANGFSSWARADVNAVHFVHGAWRKHKEHPAQQARGVRGAARGAYAGLYGAVNARLERGAFRRAGRVVAVSEKLRGELVGIGVPEARIEVIRNGVDAEEYAPCGAAERAMLRAALGVPAAGVLALFAGDLRSARKNLDGVLAAVAAVPGLLLAVAGRHEGTPWPALAQLLGIGGRVHFLGFRRDMPAVMRAADLFVFPSRYEACSLVLLEAAASGLPVVTARSAGGAEMLGGGGVVLNSAEDAAGLVAALGMLKADAGMRVAMGEKARAVALAHGWRRMAQDYVRLLDASAAGRAIAGARAETAHA